MADSTSDAIADGTGTSTILFDRWKESVELRRHVETVVQAPDPPEIERFLSSSPGRAYELHRYEDGDFAFRTLTSTLS